MIECIADSEVWTIVDTETLITSFASIKESLNNGRLKIIIPLTTIRQFENYDTIKSTKVSQEEITNVTSFLDDMLSHGSQNIHIQRVEEHYTGSLGRSLSKRNTEDMYRCMAFYQTRYLPGRQYVLMSKNVDLIKWALEIGMRRVPGVDGQEKTIG